MADIKVVDVGEIKKGSYIIIEGVACKVNDVQVSRPGKHGHAKFRIVAIGLISEKKYDIVMPHGDVEVPVVEKKSAQVMSVNGDVASVMDLESYETFELKIPEELKGQVKEGSSVLYWEILNDRVMKQIKPD